MNWKLKSYVFSVLQHLSLGTRIHKVLQKYATGRYFERLDDETFDAYNFHVLQLRQHCTGGVAMEFGSGRNLIVPLLLSHAGASAVHCFDLSRLATVEQVNDMIGQLSSRLNGKWPKIAELEDLVAKYKIYYRAPGDARATGLAAGTVDFIYSTSTLEHIPEQSICEILDECSRILKPRGILSFIIDYHDHYATADPKIGMFNFYQFSDKDWQKYNPDVHYQNRLRHSDYLRIFEARGLRPISAQPAFPAWSKSDYQRVSPDARFDRYSEADLKTGNGFFVLRKTQN